MTPDPYYLVESDKSFAELVFDLEPIVQRLGFVVLASHKLGTMLLQKGCDLDEDCQVFDVCNYRYVEKTLRADMRMALTLPWRIAVFTDGGATKVGILRPQALPVPCVGQHELARLMAEVEEKLVLIVDEVR